MGVPTWTVGEVLAAADVNAWFVPLAAVKAADTARASTTTLAADPGLTTAIAASATYDVNLVLFYNGPSGAGFKWDFSVPAGATFPYLQSYVNGAGTLVLQESSPGGTQYGETTGTASTLAVLISGTLTTSTTVSPFSLLWAQSTSNATATTLQQYSKMTLRRVA